MKMLAFVIIDIFVGVTALVLICTISIEYYNSHYTQRNRQDRRKRKKQKEQNIKETNSTDMNCKINGKEYELPGTGSISIRDGVVYVDNKKYIDGKTEFANDHIINIEVYGSVEQIASGSGTVIANGNVNFIQSSSGDIEVNGDVRGNVQSSSGDINCGNVGGDVRSTSGDINCGNVIGETHTKSGDIYHNRQKMESFIDHN